MSTRKHQPPTSEYLAQAYFNLADEIYPTYDTWKHHDQEAWTATTKDTHPELFTASGRRRPRTEYMVPTAAAQAHLERTGQMPCSLADFDVPAELPAWAAEQDLPWPPYMPVAEEYFLRCERQGIIPGAVRSTVEDWT